MPFLAAAPVAAAAATSASAAAAGAAATAGAATAATGIAAGAASATAAAASSAGWLSSLFLGSAATGSAGLIGAGGAATLTGSLGFASSLFSAGSFLLSGIQKSRALKAEGAWGKFQAKQEELAGAEDTTRMKKALNEDLAMQSARWGVAGIDPSSGVVGTNADDARADASAQIGISRADSYYRTLARRISARNSGFAAKSSIMSGAFQGAAPLLDYGAGVYERG